MKKIKTSIQDSFLFESPKFEDERGYFIEVWNQKKFDLPPFVQDNLSKSFKGVLRGLHYQLNPKAQGKLVRCSHGEIYDVIVDLRKQSSSFGKWFGIKLDKPEIQLWIPPGIAHGFYTLSNTAEIQYKVTDYFDPFYERILKWNDKELRINWHLDKDPIISKKDHNQAITFDKCNKFF